MRAQGPGGQNVNKVSSAIHLRFDIRSSSLPDEVKQRLIDCHNHRINKDGVVVIKAQRFRTREKNRQDALQRLEDLINSSSQTRKARKATKPSRAAKHKRLEDKSQRGRTKALRGRLRDYQ